LFQLSAADQEANVVHGNCFVEKLVTPGISGTRTPCHSYLVVMPLPAGALASISFEYVQ